MSRKGLPRQTLEPSTEHGAESAPKKYWVSESEEGGVSVPIVQTKKLRVTEAR